MIRLAIRVGRAHAEVVLAELLELVPAGVEESELDGGLVEYAAYGAPGELPSLPDLQAVAGGAVVEISTSEIADDWQERWREFHRPIVVRLRPGGSPADGGMPAGPRAGATTAGDRPAFFIRPPWESPAAGDAAMQEIVIDPGRAFGTGAHATTRLCLELLLELAVAGHASGPLIDLGTGSGVLAIAAARLGFAPVLGLDNEIESVRAAERNAAINRVAIAVERFDLRAESLRPPKDAVVLANLLLPLLIELSRSIGTAPRALIAGGVLREQADEAAQALARLGLRERRRLYEGEWAALLLA